MSDIIDDIIARVAVMYSYSVVLDPPGRVGGGWRVDREERACTMKGGAAKEISRIGMTKGEE